MNPATPRHPAAGLVLGMLAVALFGATLPITRWTLGASPDAALSPVFLTCGRVVLAAVISAVFLACTRAAWPRPHEWRPMAIAATGNALLYPLSLAVALTTQGAAHVAVVTALLPLATAAAASLAGESHPAPLRFWTCAGASAALVAGFSLQRSGAAFTFVVDDLIVLGGVLTAAAGYVQGARVTRRMGAEQAICWVNILAVPVSLPLAWMTWPAHAVTGAAWGGLTWLALVSMWAAFFAWYRALDWGGPLRVSQTQALQPFFSIVLAWPLLGEAPEGATLAFALAVVSLVALGTRR